MTRPGQGMASLLAAAAAAPRPRRAPSPLEGRPAAPPPVAPAPAPASPARTPGQRAGRRIRTPAHELALIAEQRARLDQREATAVKVARTEGLSWHAIAAALGVPVMTLHRRYRAAVDHH